MPRINRRVRKVSGKPSKLWPPPRTQQSSRAACACATIDELLEARTLLRNTPTQQSEVWVLFGSANCIDDELKKRLKERVEVGITGVEAAEWAEIVDDPTFVRRLIEIHNSHKPRVLSFDQARQEVSDANQ